LAALARAVGWVGGGARPSDLPRRSSVSRSCCCRAAFTEPPLKPVPRRHPCQIIKEGAAFVLHHALLRGRCSSRQFIAPRLVLLLAVFVVPYSVRHIGLTAPGVGTIWAMYGVGMVVGALLATGHARLAVGT